jgi:hypothetical protein
VIKSKVKLNRLVGIEQKQNKQVALTNLQKLKKSKREKKEVALTCLQKWKKEVTTKLKHGQEAMNL